MVAGLPEVPPDSHGALGIYHDLVNECKVRCAFDSDECTFAKFCPKYEPEDFNGGEYKVLPMWDKVTVSCHKAQTGAKFMKMVYGYKCNTNLNVFLDSVDTNHNTFKGKLPNSIEKWMLILWMVVQENGDRKLIDVCNQRIKNDKRIS